VKEVYMKKTGKAKRIIALGGVVILVGLYLVTFIAAILAKPYSKDLFIASLYCTFIIPVLIYGLMVVSKAFGRKEGEISLRELRRMNRDLKDMPEDNDQEDRSR
jgi:hypothetical protein